MARRASNRSSKAVIRVFCEGESEQAYIDFLKMQFQDVAAIKYPRGTGLFETAKDKFSKDPKWKDYANEIDEVWFFFDIAKHYPIAVENAEKTLKNLLSQGLPGLEDTDERNRWLCEKCLTFSTVQEAINYLEELRK